MEYDSVVLALAMTGLAYWYFNIRGKTKCVVITKNCSGAECVLKNK
jgi:hypothetical protein